MGGESINAARTGSDPACPAPDELSDERIIAWVLGGDVQSFAILVSRYKGLVFRLVGVHVPEPDAEDVAHEAFINAFRGLGGFRGGSFRAWFTVIVHNACADYWRRAYRRGHQALVGLDDVDPATLERALAEAADSDAPLRRREAEALVQTLFQGLSPADRILMGLLYLEDNDVASAAGQLGWSRIKVKVRAFRARKRMRAALARLLDREES